MAFVLTSGALPLVGNAEQDLYIDPFGTGQVMEHSDAVGTRFTQESERLFPVWMHEEKIRFTAM